MPETKDPVGFAQSVDGTHKNLVTSQDPKTKNTLKDNAIEYQPSSPSSPTNPKLAELDSFSHRLSSVILRLVDWG